MTKPYNGMPDDDDLTIRRRKILFRSQHRGMMEMDILLGDFAARHLESLDEVQLGRFEDLLDEGDNDVFDWITGKAPPPADFDSDVLHLIQVFKDSKFQT